ncbi:MAG TPA: NFACT RNA binding domain-containing protein [Gemmatimonadota bacterium]|nr:NFACT RNA binding domain-containing protein [Gemmatimonadota bacterium]
MSIVFDSVLTAALARELDARWSGRRLEAVRFHGEQRRARLGFADDAWVWLLHPLEGVLVPLPRRAGGDDPATGGRRSRGRRDRGLLGGPRRVVAVESPPDTRSILVRLDGPDTDDEQLVFDLVTNRWNALHVVTGRVRAVLMPDLGRDPAEPGDAWDIPVSRRRWAQSAPTAEQWEAGLRELVDEGEGPARRSVAWLSSMNEAFVLPGGPADALAGKPAIRDSLARYDRLRDAALHDPPAGWLLPRDDGKTVNDDATPRLYAVALESPGAEHVGSVLDGMAALAERAPRVAEGLRAASEDPETTRLRAALEERKERSARKIHALEAQVDTGRDPDELRQLGHLLLSRKASVPAGAEQVRLEGFGGEPVIVNLDPTLDAIGNAEALYDEAKRLERAAAQLPRRIERERRRLAALDAGLERLEANGPDDDLWKLAGGKPRGPGTTRSARHGGASTGASLPYRVYRSSGGLEIRAGRSARANDDLTFHHSAPDDIWMHVRETPGSHVVLRWGRKDQNPPQSDLAEAALVAAVLSQARGSGIVPVAWTRRKYVRKPRKAAPGAVLPERTQTVFVEPDVERVKKMAEEDPDA